MQRNTYGDSSDHTIRRHRSKVQCSGGELCTIRLEFSVCWTHISYFFGPCWNKPSGFLDSFLDSSNRHVLKAQVFTNRWAHDTLRDLRTWRTINLSSLGVVFLFRPEDSTRSIFPPLLVRRMKSLIVERLLPSSCMMKNVVFPLLRICMMRPFSKEVSLFCVFAMPEIKYIILINTHSNQMQVVLFLLETQWKISVKRN